ncbi:right-handed parallel beta-helix repeat-containing protein [Nevskia soli]|uniref:right-handed parallel beta-helix repeat-containing protein n=1 Tax=Nevskia soli TaxID=418856 RepID=UPI000A00F5AB|nr:right-handed parallel beta-helix repeat-containing protein [Nevskia soli]
MTSKAIASRCPRFLSYFAFSAIFFSPGIWASQMIVYVSVDGNDASAGLSANTGENGPVASLGRAMEVVRRLRAGKGSNTQFVVLLSPGTYRLNEPLMLDDKDSGGAATPTIIQGTDPTKVRITGTVPLLVPLTELPDGMHQRLSPQARSHVVAFDLRKNQIQTWTNPQIHGYNAPAKDNPNELFVNGVPQSLAAWPKDGYANIKEVPDGNRGLRFKIDSARPVKWHDTKSAWASGYWAYDWADSMVPLADRSADGATLTLASAPTSYGINVGQRVRFENIPEEISGPGDWYFDYTNGIAYVWAENLQQPGTVEMSVAPLLIHMSAVRNLKIENVSIDGARLDLIDAENVQGVYIDHCTLRNSGKMAVQIKGGSSSGVTYSEVQNTGATGISLSGGDRNALQPANLVAAHNVISNFGRIYRSNEPGIFLLGDGNHAEHNRIYNGPHQAVYFTGNDHTIDYNEIYDVDLDTGDAGAIYGGRDWTAQGTKIEYNYLHGIHGIGKLGATAIYVDDQGSGISIHANILYDVFRGVLIGGGLDNAVEGNIIVQSKTPIYMDNRGMTPFEESTTNDPGSFLNKELKAVPYQGEVWRKRYPQLANILSDGRGIPKRNFIWGNLIVQSGAMQMLLPPEVLAFQKVGSNLIDDSPGFLGSIISREGQAPPVTVFQLPANSKAVQGGFKQIPVDQIGP